LSVAGVAGADVGYVEAHGTGTPLGDPIEVRALGRVLGEGRVAGSSVALGSVKTNIGHLEAAAGIAGFIKAVLVVQRGEIPPHLHLVDPNPHVAWGELPVSVPTVLTPWPAERRVAGVSAFGFGGTNAHIVLESSAIGNQRSTVVDSVEMASGSSEFPTLVKVSGHGVAAVRASAARLAAFVAESEQVTPAEVAWSVGVGRADLSDRAAVVATTREELIQGLLAVADGASAPGMLTGRKPVGPAPRVGFLVPGHGVKVAGILEGLYGRIPVVTEVVDVIASVVGPVSGLPLSVLLSCDEQSLAALESTKVAQPAMYAAAVALGVWWRSVGVEPDSVIGHSVGAYAAAALAGVFSVEDGARLIATRGRLMADIPAGGAMASVACAPEELAGLGPMLSGAVVVAAFNGPKSTVVSGPLDEVSAVVAEMTARGIRAVRLRISHAFHSAEVEPVLEPLAQAFSEVTLRLPTVAMVSDASGELVGEEVTSTDYWVRHTRDPVQFADAMRTIWDRGTKILVELGAGSLLMPAASSARGRPPVCVPSVAKGAPSSQRLLGALARVWAEGAELDWSAVVGPRPARSVKLPTYAFQRRTYWPGFAPIAVAERALSEAVVAPARALPEPAVPPHRGQSRAPLETERLIQYLQCELAALMGLDDPSELDPDIGLFELGLTSAIVVDLRIRLEREIGRAIAATAVFDYPTIARLAGHLADQRHSTPGGAEAAQHPVRPAPATAEPLAIVGMGCRFPGGADDPARFWQLLSEGRDATVEVPPDRWDPDVFYDADPAAPGKASTKRGGFLATPIDEFDAEAFGISAREARGMDPQQRLLLEVAYEALADAGMTAADVDSSRTAVYVGISTNDYLQLLSADTAADGDAYLATGNTFSVAAGRLSYLLGAQGPSLAVDTACSSSLVATHLAAKSLRSGESDSAIVAGVNLMLSPATTVSLSKLGALSPDGRCKTFDAAADGYGRGEGCGVVVLKRLSDAQAAGDHVWAVLHGTAMNQDGRSAGLTVPNGLAQQAVIREALHDAGIAPEAVSYVEAHGTGTPLGDPMELQALADVLRPDGAGELPLWVGSAKTNVGHLEAAAGICGLVKVALSLYHGEIPPHLHLDTPNPHADWERLPLTVPAELTAWQVPRGSRVAGLSSFGFSGTNAHVVLAEAPARPHPVEELPRPGLLVLSARTDEGLRATMENYEGFLRAADTVRGRAAWAETVRTAAVRRDHFPARMSLVATSATDAAGQLAATLAGRSGRLRQGRAARSKGPRLVFAYSGQGSQWPTMGQSLLTDPVSARVLAECDEIVRELAGWSLREELVASRGVARLDDTEVTQPAIFAVEAALTELWRSWGIRPDAVIGHSVGEIAAAYAAGIFDLEGALRIAVLRGQVMSKSCGQGLMAVIGLSADAVRTLIEPCSGKLFVAAFNSPVNTMVGGQPEAVVALEAEVRALKAFWMMMPGDYAFHTPLMDPLRAELTATLGTLVPMTPTLPLFSTVTGELAEPDALDAAYWADNMALPVRFVDALRAAVGDGHNAIVEVGPHTVLSTAVQQTLDAPGTTLTSLASMRAGSDARATMLEAAGGLFVAGGKLDHRAVHGAGPEAAALPGYQWQRQPYWLPAKPTARTETRDNLSQDVYEVLWEPVEPVAIGPSAIAPLVGEPPTGEALHGSWLLIGDQQGLAEGLAERLVAVGARARIISAPFDVTAPDQLRELVAAALADDPAVRGLIHLGALHDGADPRMPGAELDEALALSCGPLLFAPHVLRARFGVPAPRLWVVTRGGVGTDGTTMAVSHAPAWGLGRAVALEHPEIWGGLIDLEPTTDPLRDAELIMAEVLAPDGEDQIAYRCGGRKAARLRRVQNLQAASPASVGAVVSSEGSYLITGGRGVLGQRVARWLVRNGARHLVLLGRRPVPEAGPGLEENDRHLLQTLAELREQGITVHTPQADVADPATMAAVFDNATTSWPAVRGVVHAAGLFEPRAIMDMDWEHFRWVLQPKVEGSLVLDSLTEKAALDFFVMFSSASSVWGSALAGHYVAANYFQDVLAHDRVRRGLPGLAMNWGWWEDSEMARHHEQYFESMGLHILSNEAGFAALERALGSQRYQLTVAPVTWEKFRPVMEAKRRRPLLAYLGNGPAGASAGGDAMLLGRLRDADSQAVRVRLLEKALQSAVGAVLGREPGTGIDRELGFFEAGMDSIMSVELKVRLEGLVGEELPGTVAFEHPTVAALSAYLLGEVLQLTEDRLSVPGPQEVDPPSSEFEAFSEVELLDLLEAELNEGELA
jgi:acyl transferase domain-containing protein